MGRDVDDDDRLIDGRYRLGELVGVGGTGTVFAAVDITTTPSADVAIKLLQPHLCADDAARDAFLREARHVQPLVHPNVVRVHAAGLHDAGGVVMPWIALDLLRGPTLRDRVDEAGPLAPREAAVVLDGVLAGLGAAHAAGLVHRDVSPQNVILHGADARLPGLPLTADLVRIVDFGLADATGRSTVGGDVLLAGVSASTAGRVVGNAAYMSPEQARGKPVRSVSDLYQAGAVLYFALTGQPPFPRESTEHVLTAHIVAPPPVPSALVPGARVFDRIVTRAMAKTPAHRFRDAAEFRAALAAALEVLIARRPTRPLAQPAPDVEHTRMLPHEAPASAPAASASAASAGAVVARGGGGAVLVGAVVVAVAVGAVFAFDGSGTDPSASAPPMEEVVAATPAPLESTPAAPAASSPAPVETQAPAAVTVPALIGDVAAAESALAAAGLVIGTVTRVESPLAEGRVLTQNPASGAEAAPGASVHLTVASGYNVVPQVAGVGYPTAVALLESAGFTVAAHTLGPDAVVSGTAPGAGAVLRVGVTIALVAPTPSPTSSPSPTQGSGAP